MPNPLTRAIEAAVKECFPELQLAGGADEPFYKAPSQGHPAILFYREDFARSLLHELSHYCLAGPSVACLMILDIGISQPVEVLMSKLSLRL
jgi:Uncharacterized protein conserved in bacteria